MGLEDIDDDVPCAPSTESSYLAKGPTSIDDLFGSIPSAGLTVTVTPTKSKPMDDFDMLFAAPTTTQASPVQASPRVQGKPDLLSFDKTSPQYSPRSVPAADDFLSNFVTSAKGGRPQGNAPAHTTLKALGQQFGAQSVGTAHMSAGFVDMLTHYDVIGVSPIATLDEIKAAYKKKALAMHPDKHANLTTEEQSLFKKITDAYELLSDEETRRAYDMQLRRKSPNTMATHPF